MFKLARHTRLYAVVSRVVRARGYLVHQHLTRLAQEHFYTEHTNRFEHLNHFHGDFLCQLCMSLADSCRNDHGLAYVCILVEVHLDHRITSCLTLLVSRHDHCYLLFNLYEFFQIRFPFESMLQIFFVPQNEDSSTVVSSPSHLLNDWKTELFYVFFQITYIPVLRHWDPFGSQKLLLSQFILNDL